VGRSTEGDSLDGYRIVTAYPSVRSGQPLISIGVTRDPIDFQAALGFQTHRHLEGLGVAVVAVRGGEVGPELGVGSGGDRDFDVFKRDVRRVLERRAGDPSFVVDEPLPVRVDRDIIAGRTIVGFGNCAPP